MEVPQLSVLWVQPQWFSNSSFGHAARKPVSGSQHFVIEFFLSAIVFTVCNLVFQRLDVQGLRRPPKPSAWEFLLQTCVLRRNSAVVLHNLVKRYGSVMRVRLWSQELVVLSSVAAVEEFYKLHDVEFGARPSSMGRVTLSNSVSSLCFPPLATYWKHLRFVLDMTTSTPFARGATNGIAWAVGALHQHPSVMERLREELEYNQEAHHQVQEPDIAKLPIFKQW